MTLFIRGEILAELIAQHYNFSESDWFPFIRGRNGVHPQRDTIRSYCPSGENVRMESTRLRKFSHLFFQFTNKQVALVVFLL